MSKQNIKGKIKISSYDDLFKSDSINDIEKPEVKEISLKNLYEFENHPFKVVDDDRMDELVQSIKEKGVLSPAIVRERDDGKLEII